MPDITMCRNEKCTMKKQCYRFMALPEDRYQSYSLFEQSGDGSCSYKMDIPGRVVSKPATKKSTKKK